MFSKKITYKNKFDEIYHLAKLKSKRGLLFNRNYFEAANKDGYTAIDCLATEGDKESVIFLIKYFTIFSPNLINYALVGAAAGNQIDLMEELINMGGDLNYALQGAARANNTELMERLISRGAYKKDGAIYMAAVHGHFEIVEKFLQLGGSIDYAAGGAAAGGYKKEVILFIKQGASISEAAWQAGFRLKIEIINELIPDREYSLLATQAFEGIQKGGWLRGKDENVFSLIHNFHNRTLRSLLLEEKKKISGPDSIKPLLNREEKIKQFMEKDHFSLKCARAWFTPNLHFWFSQGFQLVSTGKMPAQVYWYITTFLIGLSYEDTRQLFFKHWQTIPKKIRDNAINKIENNASSWMKTVPLISPFLNFYQEARKFNVAERYQNRIKPFTDTFKMNIS